MNERKRMEQENRYKVQYNEEKAVSLNVVLYKYQYLEDIQGSERSLSRRLNVLRDEGVVMSVSE